MTDMRGSYKLLIVHITTQQKMNVSRGRVRKAAGHVNIFLFLYVYTPVYTARVCVCLRERYQGDPRHQEVHCYELLTAHDGAYTYVLQ